MLEKLLEEIRKGGTLEANDLARRLGTTPGMVSAMLEHLQRLGHLSSYQACEDACGGCSLKNGCHSAQQKDAVRLWQT